MVYQFYNAKKLEKLFAYMHLYMYEVIRMTFSVYIYQFWRKASAF